MIEAAVDLARRGFRVHPLRAKDQPLTAYSRTATSIVADVAAMWRRWPDGLVVIDDDRGTDHPDRELCSGAVANTPSRGFHYFFRCDVPIRNSVGKLAPGVDVRGEGGYVVAPPSEGREWLAPPKHASYLAPLPGLLMEACQRIETAERRAFEPRAYVPAGERHDYLVRFCGWAIANELCDDADLRDAVLHHAFDVCEPWSPSEIPAVTKNIAALVRWVLARERSAR